MLDDIEKLFETRHGEYWGSAIRGREKFVSLLWITKNCSSFFRENTNDIRVSCDDYNTVVAVLRDPLDRYISGLIHYRAVNDISSKQWLDNVKKGIVYFDVHTIPQSRFVKNIPDHKLDYFLYNDSVLERIKKKYGIRWNHKIRHNAKQRVHRKYQFEKELILYLRENKDYFNLVQQRLESDYILMDQVLPHWRDNQFDIWDDKHLEDWR